jgi:hypothetical protein
VADFNGDGVPELGFVSASDRLRLFAYDPGATGLSPEPLVRLLQDPGAPKLAPGAAEFFPKNNAGTPAPGLLISLAFAIIGLAWARRGRRQA